MTRVHRIRAVQGLSGEERRLCQQRRLSLQGRMGLLAIGAAAAVSCADQPEPYCIATTLPFAMKLIQGEVVESTPGACEPFLDTFIVEPRLGLWPYYQSGSDGQPDYERGSVGIQTADLGSRVYTAQEFGVDNTAPDGQLYSLGDFVSPRPDDQNFCPVVDPSPTRVVLPAVAPVPDDPATADVDETFAGQDAVDSTIVWSNVRVYVTAGTFGTQMDGDFADTRVTPTGDSCTINYRALGLAPAVRCAATDADGNEIVNPDGTYEVDSEICNPEPNLAAGRPTGSGISPSVLYECDPITAYCLVAGDSIPALR